MSTNRLLRQFYGLEDAETNDDTDIDSPNFNPHKYFEENSKNLSIPNIIAKQNQIISEIRTHENELQTIVYGNYQKFLHASDVVSEFNSQIGGLKDKVGELKSHFSEMKARNDVIENKYGNNKQEVVRLTGISRLLERVKFIMNLPEELNKCLQTENYKKAVNIWLKVEKILANHKQIPSFQSIESQCLSIMKDIKSRICGQMLNTDITVSDSIDYAVLLVRLGSPLRLICSQLAHQEYLIIDNRFEDDSKPSGPFDVLDQTDELAIRDATEFVKLFKERLVPLETDATGKISGVLSDFTTKTFDRVCEFVNSGVSLTDLTVNDFFSYLEKFDQLLSSIASSEQLSLHTHRVLVQYIEAATAKIYVSASDYIINNIKSDAAELSRAITEPILTLITQFAAFSAKYGECGMTLAKQIQLSLLKLFEVFKNTPGDDILVLSKIAQKLSEGEIDEIYQRISDIEPDIPPLSIELTNTARRTSEQCLLSFITAARRQIDLQLSKDMMKYNNYLEEEPNYPSEAASNLMATLKDYSQRVAALFSPANFQMTFSPRKIGSSSNAPSFNGIRDENDISQMFHQASFGRLFLNPRISMDPAEITFSLIIYAAKSFLEFVRPMMFSKFGFNQVQVDGFCLSNIFQFVEKVGFERIDNERTGIVTFILEEAVYSAGDRTDEFEPFQMSKLYSIWDLYKNKASIQ